MTGPASVDVRPASPDDVAAIRRVARRAWHAAHVPIVGEAAAERFLDAHYDAASVRGRVERTDVVLRVATASGEGPCGFAAASPRDDDPGAFSLGQLYVDPHRWGEGVGSGLLSAVEAAVSRRGGERVRLGVMAANDRAVGFYEAAGYRRVDEFFDDRLDVDGLTYEKVLG